MADPKDIAEALRPSIESFGGKVVACFLTVEGYEPIGFVEFPDNKSAAAWGMFMTKQRGVKSVRITPLMTTQDGVEAMRKAGSVPASSTAVW